MSSPVVPVSQPTTSSLESISGSLAGKAHRGGAMADMTDMKVLRKKLQEQRDYDSTEHNEMLNRMHVCFGHFHPEAKQRIVWDVMLLFLIVYCAVVVPLDLGLGGLENDHLEMMNHFILVCFSIDIMLNFNTAYYDSDGTLVTRQCKMIKRYLKGWFLLDFFSTFPFDLVLTAVGATGTNFDGQLLMRLPRIIKCTRLARMMRIAKVQVIMEKVVGLYLLTSIWFTVFLRISSLFLALLLISHWSSCGFCKLAEIEEDPSITDDVFDGEEHIGWSYQGVNALDMSPMQRYGAAFYLSFCMLTMAKPRDIGFLTSYCRYYFMLFGFVKPMVGATIMGVLTNMIVKQNSRKGQLQQKRQTLGKFMQQKQVDTNTVHQVLAYVDHADAQIRSAQEVEAVKGLSPTLRDELAFQTMHTYISKFTLLSNEFGASMVRSLCPVLKLEHYGPDDLVFQEGHLMGGMVFLNAGTFKQFRHVVLPRSKTGHDPEASDSGDSEGPLSNYEELPEVTGDSEDVGSSGLWSDVVDRVAAAATDVVDRAAQALWTEGRMKAPKIASSCLGAQAILCEHHRRSKTTVLCYTFCELTFLTRADFKKVVAQNPKWGHTLDRIGRILAPFDDNSEVMQALNYGDSKPLEALLPHTSKEEAHRQWNKLRIYNKSAFIVNRSLHSQKENDEKEVGERIKSEAQRDATSTGWATGFQSMQLNAKERQIMQDLQRISERQTKMERTMEYRMDKLELMTSETNQMLKQLLSGAQCSASQAEIPISKEVLSTENATKAFPTLTTEDPKHGCSECVKNSSGPVIGQRPATETISAMKPTEKAGNDDAISVAKAPTSSTASTVSIAVDPVQDDIPLMSNAQFSKWISQVSKGQKRHTESEEIPMIE